MNNYNYELKVRTESIIENFNEGLYTSAREAILDGVKLGLEMCGKVYDEKLTPEQDNMYQAQDFS